MYCLRKEVKVKIIGITILIFLGISLLSAIVSVFIKDPIREEKDGES